MTEQPLTQAEITAAEQKAAKEGYVKRLLVGLDQFLNVITGGKPDETISARSQRAADNGSAFGKFMVGWLGKLQKKHGVKAIVGDLTRAEGAEQTETKALAAEDQALGVKK